MVRTDLTKKENDETDDKIESFDKVLSKREKDELSVDIFAGKLFNPKKKDDPFDKDNFGDFNL